MVSLGLATWPGCGKPTGGEAGHQAGGTYFSRLDPAKSGITFANQLTETEDLNVLSYEYFYNGGGVAVGDINNDGLPDLYFSGNMVPNKLYLNKGNLQFEDVTEVAGLAGRPNGWNTGVSFVDINADGWLDLYLAYSGDKPEELRRNELYISNGPPPGEGGNGVPTFTEKAAEYGLADPAYTTHSLFFDYDRDGDLDCYLLNHSIDEYQNFDAAFVKKMTDEFAGDKLFRNDNGKFTEVTKAAGIHNNPLGFGLGVAASDLDNDGWPDLYVSNDYTEEDYLYLNNGDGTFREDLENRLGHIPNFSMGNDIADFNNDALPDIMALDMLPADNRRQKLLYGPDEYEKYQSQLRNGFYHQVMRNMLQVNNGDGTFSEVGQLAGVSNTDWSWAALMADFDNDGWKDLFISNGYLRDYTNRDFMSYYAAQRIKEARGETSEALMEIIGHMESTKTHNYIFRNEGGLQFSNQVENWGFETPMLTNGAAYADLDNDGDLDLILNNVNEPVAIFENKSSGGHYLKVKLEGGGGNRYGIGARVEVRAGGNVMMQEFFPTRGFQSSLHTPLHFGLGSATVADSVLVRWPDGQEQLLTGVEAGQVLALKQAEASGTMAVSELPALFGPAESPLPFTHVQPPTVDFKRQSLLPYMMSGLGPAMAKGDVNGDGLEDVFMGGAKLQAGEVFIQQAGGAFRATGQEAFKKDVVYEDVDAAFFDADQDGDLDLYVVSGGYDYLPEDLGLQDRLYLNDGSGGFSRSKDALPLMRTSGACVAVADADGDGAADLFVGGRLIPGEYPKTPVSYLLLNDGKGKFRIATDEMAPGLSGIGMVTAACWLDGGQTLAIAGDWMPLTFFHKEKGQFKNVSAGVLETPSAGLWCALAPADLDGDGDEDLVAGNFGTNSQMKASPEEPATLYYADFDDNGAVDPILTYYIQGKPYPAFSRDELFSQLVSMKKKFTDYASYADAGIEDILSPEQLKMAKQLKAVELQTVWLENQGNGRWSLHPLPAMAQVAPVFAIQPLDANGDGLTDLLLAGNYERTRANWGRFDANHGVLLLNKGDGQWSYVPQHRSGFRINGDARHILSFAQNGRRLLLIGRTNAPVSAYIQNKEVQ
ncbi:MAG: VCBS repeat-containing protein [Lewinellaceae bacterium]|nr:VCBS repeat-containing protein [Lewinellaceae bacterium]